MNPLALPQGTVIRVGYPDPGSGRAEVELERTEKGWLEVGYHCIDCAASWDYTPTGLQGDVNAASGGLRSLDLDATLDREGTWEVVSVPAKWLADRLEAILPLDTPEADADVRSIALDAGLS